MRVSDMLALIDSIAPFETQESYDNSGLLTGHPDWTVKGMHFALDVTDRVIDEALESGANLIVTHHPLMFSPRKVMTECDREGVLLCRLIRERIALIAAHTNLDQAPGGINDALASRLGLREVSGEGFIRVGLLPEGMTAGDLPGYAQEKLGDTVRVIGQMDANRPLRMMALCSGAGGELWEEGQRLGAEVFLTGEIRHHHALALADAGLLGLECGHFATEEPGIFALADALQTRLDALQWKCSISRSRCGRYAPPAKA
ncbi:MAG: Nif3-like dinuclear metal center hexameric protein [Clostridia bacterium]|nr:Nif3-like dinuclear metal center hexameric protein [Clostridia bacterium]